MHHLWFSEDQYESKGSLIKWNPAVKTAQDRQGLWEALSDDRIDIIATDHAPHTWEEKQNPYTSAPSGGPLVQHLIPALMEKSLEGVISPERIVEKLCHNPAIRFDIKDRGYLREGYFADLAVVESGKPWTVEKQNILYKCGWSPFEGTRFSTRISHTFVNGHLAFEAGEVSPERHAKRLQFNR